MISVSENYLVETDCFCLQNKISPFLRQGIYIYVGHSFFVNERQLDYYNSFNLSV